MITIGAAPLGAFAGGFLAEAIGLRATAAVAGVGVLLAFIWIALSPVRSLRTLSMEPDAVPPTQHPTRSTMEPSNGTDAREPIVERV